MGVELLHRLDHKEQQHLDTKLSPSARRNLCGGKTKQRNIKAKESK